MHSSTGTTTALLGCLCSSILYHNLLSRTKVLKKPLLTLTNVAVKHFFPSLKVFGTFSEYTAVNSVINVLMTPSLTRKPPETPEILSGGKRLSCGIFDSLFSNLLFTGNTYLTTSHLVSSICVCLRLTIVNGLQRKIL